MPEIFVSYSQRDKPIARYIAVNLQERGGALRSHSLEKCTHLLLIHSPRAAASTRVAAEVAAGLRARLPLIVVVVAELGAEDLPIAFDLNVTRLRLTRPDEAAEALNALAALFELPDSRPDLPDAETFAPVEPDADVPSDQLAADDPARAELLFAAAEQLGTAPGAALFLLRALVRDAPDDADSSTLTALIEVKFAAWHQATVAALAQRATDAIAARDFAAAQAEANQLMALAPDHAQARDILERLRGAQIDAWLEQVEALARASSWTTPQVAGLIAQMRALSPDDERVRKTEASLKRAQAVEVIYTLAERASQADQPRATAALMAELATLDPDFGDPRRVMSQNPIQTEFIALLRATDVLRDHTGAVRSLAYSPDGTLLVSGGADATLRLWDMTETPRRVAVLRVPERAIRTIRFSPDGLAMVTTGASRVVRVWSMPEGREAILLDQFDSDVTCAIFTPDGAALICGYTNGQVEALDLQSGRVLARINAHKASINDLALSPSADSLLTVSDDGTLKVWPLNRAGLPDGPLRYSGGVHTMLINALAVSGDGRYTATASNDEQVVMWRIEDGGTHWAMNLGVQLRAATFAPIGSLLVCGGADGALYAIDSTRGEMIRRLAGHERAINALVFAPDGVTLASGGSDNSIRLWRLGS